MSRKENILPSTSSSSESDSSQSQSSCQYSMFSNLCEESSRPYLVIIEEPIDKIRFRYQSEKGSHGDLSRSDGIAKKKVHPTLKLKNYHVTEPVIIRALLYTDDYHNPTEHVHKLSGRNCNDGKCEIALKKDMTAEFTNIFIQIATKKETEKLLLQWKGHQKQDKLAKSEIKKLNEKMNKDRVRLGFQAFTARDLTRPLCPIVFSQPVINIKSPVSGDLKIVRISKCSGRCTGDEEVFLLCEKVQKENIRVKFFEFKDNCQDNETIWEAEGNFKAADVHHQVAIVFKTPCYKKTNIDENVEVYMGLFRTNDGFKSELIKFTYYPFNEDSEIISRKRKKPNIEQNAMPQGFLYSQNENESSLMNYIRFTDETSFEDKLMLPNDLTSADYLCENFNEDIFNRNIDSILQKDDDMYDGEPDTLEGQYRGESAPEGDKYDGFIVENQRASPVPILKKRIIRSGGYLPPYREGTDLVQNNPQGALVEQQSLSYTRFEHNSGRHSFFNYLFGDLIKDLGESIVKKVYQMSLGVKEMYKKARASEQPDHYLTEISDEGGNNIFHVIISSPGDNAHFMKTLLNCAHADRALNQPNFNFKTPIQMAVELNKPLILKQLLTKVEDVDRQRLGNTFLHTAAEKDSDKCIRVLAAFKHKLHFESLDSVNYEGLSPLHIAVEDKHFATMKALLECGSDVNFPRSHSFHRPLHLAVIANSYALVTLLLDQPGVVVNFQDSEGNTPLDLAKASGNVMIVEALTEVETKHRKSRVSDSTKKPGFDLTRLGLDLEIPNISNRRIKNEVLLSSKSKVSDGVPKKILNDTTEVIYKGQNVIGDANRLLDEQCRTKLCSLLNPPNTGWKTLGMYLGWEENYLNRIGDISSNPTSTLLTKFQSTGGTISELIRILKCSDNDCLEDGAEIILKYNKELPVR